MDEKWIINTRTRHGGSERWVRGNGRGENGGSCSVGSKWKVSVEE